jgi:hypothetical protein
MGTTSLPIAACSSYLDARQTIDEPQRLLSVALR